MCRRLCCPFRKTSQEGDEITNILIFGLTGMTGGSVMDATLGCAWFKVNGVTRSNHGVMYEELISKGVTVFTGDMSKAHTLRPAMKDVDTVFLVTTYWESMNVEREYMQGVNVVNVALDSGVKHLIFSGTDYNMLTAKDRCKYLEGKAKIENFIVASGIPYTFVHLGFYYENFVSLFKPHPVRKNKFAIALPMGTKALNCGSVQDFGQCISKIALRPQSYIFRTIRLSTAYLTVTQMAAKFERHFPTRTFIDPMIPLVAYQKFPFEGAEEITTMFAHYRTAIEWDRSLVSELIPSCKTLDMWLKDNDKVLLDLLGEQMNKEYRFRDGWFTTGAVNTGWSLKKIFGETYSAIAKQDPLNAAPALSTQETERHKERCKLFESLHPVRTVSLVKHEQVSRYSYMWYPNLLPLAEDDDDAIDQSK